jgi:hypothetical protein
MDPFNLMCGLPVP